MSTMAAVSQPSRLLAKLRMACVRAPGGHGRGVVGWGAGGNGGLGAMGSGGSCRPLVAGLGIAAVRGSGGGIGFCPLVAGLGIAVLWGTGWGMGCCPLVVGLGIAAVLGSWVGNGGAAPCWWDWELQPCRGLWGGMELLLPGGGIRNCSCAGVMGGECGCCPLVVGCRVVAVGGRGVWGDPTWEWGVLRGLGGPGGENGSTQSGNGGTQGAWRGLGVWL